MSIERGVEHETMSEEDKDYVKRMKDKLNQRKANDMDKKKLKEELGSFSVLNYMQATRGAFPEDEMKEFILREPRKYTESEIRKIAIDSGINPRDLDDSDEEEEEDDFDDDISDESESYTSD
jgi:hypothetical protein